MWDEDYEPKLLESTEKMPKKRDASLIAGGDDREERSAKFPAIARGESEHPSMDMSALHAEANAIIPTIELEGSASVSEPLPVRARASRGKKKASFLAGKNRNADIVMRYCQDVSDSSIRLENGNTLHEESQYFLRKEILTKMNKGDSLICPDRSDQKISVAREPLPKENFLASLDDAGRLAHEYFDHWYDDYKIFKGESRNQIYKSSEELRTQFDRFSADYSHIPKIAQSLVEYERTGKVDFPHENRESTRLSSEEAHQREESPDFDSYIYANIVEPFINAYCDHILKKKNTTEKQPEKHVEAVKGFLDKNMWKNVSWDADNAVEKVVDKYADHRYKNRQVIPYVANGLVSFVRENSLEIREEWGMYHGQDSHGESTSASEMISMNAASSGEHHSQKEASPDRMEIDAQQSTSSYANAKIAFWHKTGLLIACDQLPDDKTMKSIEPFLKNPGTKKAFILADNVRYEEHGKESNYGDLLKTLDAEKKSKDHEWHCRLQFTEDKLEVNQVHRVAVKQVAREHGGRG